MKKFVINVAVIFLTTCGLNAQDIKFGIRGGLNVPSLMAGGNDTPLSEGYSSRLAPAWGIFTELQLNPVFSLRLGVEYSGMGGKKNGMQAMPTARLITELGSSFGMGGKTPEQQMALGGMMAWSEATPYFYADIKNTAKFDYIMIPMLAQFGRDLGTSPWRVYVNAGPFVSFLLSGNRVSEGTSKMFADPSGTQTLWDVMPDETKMAVSAIFPQIESTMNEPVIYGTTKITGELKSANFGVTGNVGIRYQHSRNFFFIEAGGNYGFIKVQQNDAHGSNRIGAASVMLGYSFSFF